VLLYLRDCGCWKIWERMDLNGIVDDVFMEGVQMSDDMGSEWECC
jgi:hypothetical protein